MPTAVRLNGVSCTLDTDQDPEAFNCNWYGYEVPTGDTFVLNGLSDATDPPGDTLTDLLTEADYELE